MGTWQGCGRLSTTNLCNGRSNEKELIDVEKKYRIDCSAALCKRINVDLCYLPFRIVRHGSDDNTCGI
jgi:hypothetical protein